VPDERLLAAHVRPQGGVEQRFPGQDGQLWGGEPQHHPQRPATLAGDSLTGPVGLGDRAWNRDVNSASPVRRSGASAAAGTPRERAAEASTLSSSPPRPWTRRSTSNRAVPLGSPPLTERTTWTAYSPGRPRGTARSRSHCPPRPPRPSSLLIHSLRDSAMSLSPHRSEGTTSGPRSTAAPSDAARCAGTAALDVPTGVLGVQTHQDRRTAHRRASDGRHGAPPAQSERRWTMPRRTGLDQPRPVAQRHVAAKVLGGRGRAHSAEPSSVRQASPAPAAGRPSEEPASRHRVAAARPESRWRPRRRHDGT
jgi:hypothetical protein